jgi:hypothetical protein
MLGHQRSVSALFRRIVEIRIVSLWGRQLSGQSGCIKGCLCFGDG